MIGHRCHFGENDDLPLRRGPVVKKKPPFSNARALITPTVCAMQYWGMTLIEATSGCSLLLPFFLVVSFSLPSIWVQQFLRTDLSLFESSQEYLSPVEMEPSNDYDCHLVSTGTPDDSSVPSAAAAAAAAAISSTSPSLAECTTQLRR